MTTLLIISDIHGRLGHIRALARVQGPIDGLIVAGDLTDFGNMAAAARLTDTLKQVCETIAVVPGNCDTHDVQLLLEAEQIGVHGQCKRIAGLDWIGIGGVLPDPIHPPNDAGENAGTTLLDQGLSAHSPDVPLCVLSHQPAFGTRLDSLSPGRHTGSRAIRSFIETHAPLLAVSGHIHDAMGTDRIGRTTLVNPGPLKQGFYAVVFLDQDHVQEVRFHRL